MPEPDQGKTLTGPSAMPERFAVLGQDRIILIILFDIGLVQFLKKLVQRLLLNTGIYLYMPLYYKRKEWLRILRPKKSCNMPGNRGRFVPVTLRRTG
ncbi:MAG: hypothetical protein KIT79_00905 [Deltaproteobacteria bacterium]|nr:hypothetical protein [Deltaproteobacteria bacterium]